MQKRYWPGTKAIMTQCKSDTDPVQKRYWPGTKAIPFDTVLVPLHNVPVPSVPEPVTIPVLLCGTGTCTGMVCKTCIERYRIGTLYRIQRYRTGTAYHRWTVPERVPIDTGLFTGMSTPGFQWLCAGFVVMWLVWVIEPVLGGSMRCTVKSLI